MRDAGPSGLTSIDIVDEYRHEENGAPLRTLTYQLTFANPEFSITAEEVNQIAEGLIAQVDETLGEKGVRLR